MNQTIKLDAKKREGSFCKERIYPLRRGERNNVTLTVAVRRDRRPYDLAGMTAHLVWQAADGKLVGPVPMEVTDQAAGAVRCTLPDACYAAVGTARAYIEIRNGVELVDTTDEMLINVLDCIDADAEQAEEYKPLIAEVREATDAAIKAAAKAVTDTQAAIAEVKATEAKLYPAAENILVRSETGTVAHVSDAFDGATLRKITVEGACKQDGTPSPDNPVPIQVVENPVLWVAGANLLNPTQLESTGYFYSAVNGELQVNVNDGRAWTSIAQYGVLPAGTYYIGGDSIEIRRTADNASLAFTTGAMVNFKLATATSIKIKVGFGHPENQYPYVSHVMVLASSGNDVAYAPYVSTSTPFALPAEHPYLAKLPGGTADEIVVDEEGNAELVARVGIDKNVREVGDFAQGQYYSLHTSIVPYASASVPSNIYGRHVLCNALPYKNAVASGEGIYRTWNGI